jgi:N-dimethylarginine dimethylaminohydrolase
MDKEIDLSKSVHDICREFPEMIDILKELGFESITVPGMLNTAGRFMTIPKGAVMKGMEMGRIIEELTKRGFTIKE